MLDLISNAMQSLSRSLIFGPGCSFDFWSFFFVKESSFLFRNLEGEFKAFDSSPSLRFWYRC